MTTHKINFILPNNVVWLDVPGANTESDKAKISEFNDAVNNLVKDIENLIVAYNNDEIEQTKLEKLNNISSLMKTIDNKFPGNFYQMSQNYRKLRADLFKEVKSHKNNLGVKSILDPNDKSTPLSEIIANMSPEKLDLFASILVTSKTKDARDENLNLLYEDNYQPADEAKRFLEFISSHEIRTLGGGNSKNFAIKDNAEQLEVLKLENRLDQPKDIEEMLRKELGDRISPTRAERPVCLTIYDDDREMELSFTTLLVTDFYESRSVLEYSNELMKSNDDVGLCLDATKIIGEMGVLLNEMKEKKFFFPDAKLTNWMVKDGKLFISDTKSIISCEQNNEEYDASKPESKYYCMLSTNSFKSPEMKDKNTPFYIDSSYAYILGLNLYCFLTGSANPIYMDNRNPSEVDTSIANLDFDKPIFDTRLGNEFVKLILNLTKSEVFLRLPIENALIQLNSIKESAEEMIKQEEIIIGINEFGEKIGFINVHELLMPNFDNTPAADKKNKLENLSILVNKLNTINVTELKEVIFALKSLKFGEHDTIMQEFIKSKLSEYINSPDTRVETLTELNDTIKDLNEQGVTHIHGEVKNLKEQGDTIISHNTQKAKAIEDEMKVILMKDRRAFLKSSNYNNVMDQLARKDHFWGLDDKPKKINNEIDPNHAAETFNNFKSRYNDVRKCIQSDHVEKAETSKESSTPKPQ